LNATFLNEKCLYKQMENDLDAKLMLKFKQGDRSAFDALFEKYKKPLLNYIYRFSGNAMMAEELTQETFLRLYQSAKAYEPRARFSTWIFRIATNLCLNEKRKVATKILSGKDGDSDSDVETLSNGHWSAAPDKIVEQRELQALVQKAMLALPDKQRAALLLLIQGGFTYKEIGSQMNMSEKAVKSLIFRARQNLKQKLSKII